MLRREFLQVAGATAGLTTVVPWYARAQMIAGAKTLATMIDDEAQFNYRDRLPESFDFDWQKIITSARDGQIGDATLDPSYRGKQVAIIGAGAAGLAAGYELMKLGLQPVYYEMQKDPVEPSYARPMGRGFSWDFTSGGGGFGYAPASVSGPEPASGNVEPRRAFSDLGAMRYPSSHIALRTYVDEVFAGDYYYGNNVIETQWPEWRDPGLFEGAASDTYGTPKNTDRLKFPTVIYTTGIANASHLSSLPRGYYRMNTGLLLGKANAAINNLIFSNFNLLFGPSVSGTGGRKEGYLRALVDTYVKYTQAIQEGNTPVAQKAEAAIKRQWSALNEQFQGASLYEVLSNSENKWDILPAYPGNLNTNPAQSTLIEMFGEIGIGSGGFDVFWWTTFMETLRIRIHLDEVQQDAFVGGTSYMLSPFLTHNAILYDGSKLNLWSATSGSVITAPVKAITPRPRGTGVTVTTEDGDTKDYIACIMTASPAAVRSRLYIDPTLLPTMTQNALRRVRLTNSGKIQLYFPNSGDTYSKAFWMKRSAPDYSDPKDDLIVTTLTDENIRSVYTFDDYNWGSWNSPVEARETGALMLSYTWDDNSGAFAALDEKSQAEKAWDQVIRIYTDPGNTDKTLPADVEDYFLWAIDNKQYRSIVWSNEDGFLGGYRMNDVGRNQYKYTAGNTTYSEQSAYWQSCLSSFNWDTGQETGLFLAGEGAAWLGLSGWIEGAIHTGLVSTIGVVSFINVHGSQGPGNNTINGTKFSLPYLPGAYQFKQKSVP